MILPRITFPFTDASNRRSFCSITALRVNEKRNTMGISAHRHATYEQYFLSMNIAFIETFSIELAGRWVAVKMGNRDILLYLLIFYLTS